ncbi:sodium/proline symporter PutP [Parageobacillus thermoglucosidasius]|jgi:sodium/proline symporter|uniref:sodium/proline symporter PutP n=1 Tax=Parageobacillus thermoglucosidasius TaxID=1426 RepID=UPI000B54BD0B|nr:sodium/proline symporter PutP [Parageobacillus thermoglucosidasius]MBO2481422.1 sodium/proline symporter PutP [Bacillaceae bacterium]OUM91845.1 MAG: sodium/proline symporter [Parageobacillus thermoglucosidasius]
MGENGLKLLAIGVYMVAMLIIGWYGYRRTKDLSDYMLGGRSLGPAVSALSAGAADMSGWLMMGFPGAVYGAGLSQVWIAIGLTVGAYLNWLLVAPRLRVYTEVANNSITIPSFFENRFKDSTLLLRIVSSLVILVFFTFYVSSGIVAGAVFFDNTFDLSYHAGLIILTSVVLLYTLAGGFLAVSWTDFVQGLIMLSALLLIPLIAFFHTGGVQETFATIEKIDPALLSLFGGTTAVGIVSSLAWGLGYVGQPHIIVRFMAIQSAKEVKIARRIGIGWMILCLLGATFTALAGIAFYEKTGYELSNPEAVFIDLGQILFHPFIAGLVLSAVLAAIMSTISSQLIVTSSALTEDLFRLVKRNVTDKELVFLGRLSVLIVTVVAAAMAWVQSDTILALVAHAWAGFGASFGPVVFLGLFWKKMTNWGAIAGMAAGAITVLVWPNIDFQSWLDDLYEMVPGFLLNLVFIYIVSLLTYKPNEQIESEFKESLRRLHESKGN